MAHKAIITTFHKALSYGGCLQAYATMLLVRDVGHDPVFLDYENPFEARKKSAIGVLSRGSIREFASTLAKDVFFHGRRYRKRAFGTFSSNIPLTSRKYDHIEQADEIEADAFVVGSDQVWNPEITNGIERAFLLDFGKDGKRISLASSMGSCRLSEDELVVFAEKLGRFDAISVREEFARRTLASEIDCDIHVMLDPTLLVDAARWRESFVPVKEFEPQDYILLFMVANGPSQYRAVIESAKHHFGLPVVQIRLNSSRPRGVDSVFPATPFEFGWLIDNAAFVITDSFHGLAFSLNLQTPFAVLPNTGNNVRLEELLALTGTSDRQITEVGEFEGWDSEIDFAKVGAILDSRRCADLRWIESAFVDGE